jgi:hypothetical protein
MIPTTFTFLTIAQWIENNPDLKLEKGECSCCDGTGEHRCECGDEHECNSCDGTGREEGETFLDLYKDQLARDIDRLEKYLKVNSGESVDLAIASIEETKLKLIKDACYWRPKVYKQ